MKFNGQITVLCGEYSGEVHAANLVSRLSSLIDAGFYALGGTLLRKEGVEVISDYRNISVTGSIEVLRKVLSLWKAYHTMVNHIKRVSPSLVILVDFPGFNLRIAKVAKKLGLSVIYFVPPQIWAWGKGRIKYLKNYVDLVLCFFPFEKEIYDSFGVRCEFVGHPYVRSVRPRYEKEEFLKVFQIPDTFPLIAILPGSRQNEVKRHMPFLRLLMEKIESTFKYSFFLIAQAHGIDRKEIERHVLSKKNVRIVENFSHDVLFHSDCAVLSSGSATLEAAILGVPSVVIYRLSEISYLLAKILVKVRYVSLPNLILGEKVFPEFIQRLDAEKIAVELMYMLKKKEEMKAKGEILTRMLEGPGPDPYETAAKCVYNFLSEKYGSVSEAA